MHKTNHVKARRRFGPLSAVAVPAAMLLGSNFARATSIDTTWTGANSSDPLDLSSTTNWTPNQKPANGYLATIDNSVQTVPATLYFQNTLTPTAQSYGGILINSSTLTNIYADEQSPASSTTLTDPVYGTSGDGMNEPVFSLGANVNQNVSFSDSTNAPDSLELATATAIMNVTNADATLTINSKISSTAALTTLQKTGAGELALFGGNSFGNNGTTNVVNVQDSAGTIAIDATNGLGAGTTTFQFDGGALLFTNTASISVAHVMTVDSNGGEIDNNGVGTVTLTSALDGSGPLIKGGSSELYLSSTTSTYNGMITVNNGNVRLIGPGALAYQSTGPSSNATIDLVGANSTLNIRDNNSDTYNVNVIAQGNAGQIYATTTGSTTGQTITIGTIALGTTLNINGNSLYPYTIAASTLTLTGTGTILTSADAFKTSGIAQSGGPASLVKTGATNTMTITGNSTYTGTTTISAGTLALSSSTSNNTIASSSQINVASGGTLDVSGITASGGFELASSQTLAGSGTVKGALTVASGSTITAGSGATSAGTIGALNTGAQTWNRGGTYVVKIDGNSATPEPAGTTSSSASDELIMSGLSASSTGLSVSPTAINGTAAFTLGSTYSWVIANNPNATSATTFETLIGNMDLSIADSTLPSGSYAFEDETASGGGDDLVLTYTDTAPEPTSTFLFGMVTAPLMLARRRKATAKPLASLGSPALA